MRFQSGFAAGLVVLVLTAGCGAEDVNTRRARNDVAGAGSAADAGATTSGHPPMDVTLPWDGVSFPGSRDFAIIATE